MAVPEVKTPGPGGYFCYTQDARAVRLRASMRVSAAGALTMNAMTPHGRTVAGVQNRYVSKNCPGLRSKTGPTGRYRLAGPNLGRRYLPSA